MPCATGNSTSYCLNPELRKGTPFPKERLWKLAWAPVCSTGHSTDFSEALPEPWPLVTWSAPKKQAVGCPGFGQVCPDSSQESSERALRNSAGLCWALLGWQRWVPLKQRPHRAAAESVEAAHVLMNRNSWQHSPREALSHSGRFSGFTSPLTKQGLQRIFVQTFLPPPHWNLKQNVMEIQVLLQLAITKPKI